MDWAKIILDSPTPEVAWQELFSCLHKLSTEHCPSPVALHDATVIPDRLLSEAAWELWAIEAVADEICPMV